MTGGFCFKHSPMTRWKDRRRISNSWVGPMWDTRRCKFCGANIEVRVA